MNTTEMGDMRRAAIIEDYFALVRQGVKLKDAIEIIAKRPAPRFYISLDHARRSISLYRKGRLRLATIKMEQIVELDRRLRATGDKGYERLAEIITQPAPSYYIEALSIRGAIYKKLRER